MGIFDDLGLADELKAITEEENKFKPQELNEANVQAIFHRCLEKEAERGHGKKNYAQILQEGLSGKDSTLITFDAQRRFENLKNISYLLGQLKGVHNGDRLMPLEYGILTYQSKKWTIYAETLYKLYELGMANGDIVPFTLQDDGKTLLTDISHLTPTLSPKDPSFPAWWEEHKAEWED